MNYTFENWCYSDATAEMVATEHLHAENEIYFLLSGRRRYTVENEIYDLQPGDVILIPAMTLHSTLCIPGTPKSEIHSRFLQTVSPFSLPDGLSDCFKHRLYRPDREAEVKLRAIAAEALTEMREQKSNCRFILEAGLIKTLAIISRCKSIDSAETAISDRDKTIQSAALYIREHCGEALTLGEAASRFYFSREYFSLIFKKTMGIGFGDYLTSCRITRSLSLLRNESLSVTDISAMCGFNDSNYFATVFKRAIGKAPGEYRREQHF